MGRLCYMSMAPIINITNLNISRKKNPSFFVRPLLGWCICESHPTKRNQIITNQPWNVTKIWVHLLFEGISFLFLRLTTRLLDTPTLSSWWFQPISKIFVKLDHFPKWGWTQKIFETTTQLFFLTAIFAFWPRWSLLCCGGRTALCVKVSKSERFETSMTLQSFPLHPNGYTPEFTNMTGWKIHPSSIGNTDTSSFMVDFPVIVMLVNSGVCTRDWLQGGSLHSEK